MTVELPAPVLEERNGFVVVRDDMLPGGSKRRALTPFFASQPDEEFVFGGSAQGYAQLAMAWSARDTGKRATYFVARRKELHPLTAEAQRVGATIVQVPHGRLNVVQRRGRDYCEQTGARFLPLGFDIPEFSELLTAAIRPLAELLDPPEVWACSGSGCLTRCLQDVWPEAQHHAVQIGFDTDCGDARLWIAPEPFEKTAKEPPPFDSAGHYDSKVWAFMLRHARPGALFWNVGA